MVVFNSDLTLANKFFIDHVLLRKPAKPIEYAVRYWSHADKQWVNEGTFTNKALAMKAQKTYGPSEKATVIAKLSNGKKVFISGTKR